MQNAKQCMQLVRHHASVTLNYADTLSSCLRMSFHGAQLGLSFLLTLLAHLPEHTPACRKNVPSQQASSSTKSAETSYNRQAAGKICPPPDSLSLNCRCVRKRASCQWQV